MKVSSIVVLIYFCQGFIDQLIGIRISQWSFLEPILMFSP